jgi:ribosomal protein L11 methyltransferase
MLDQPMAGRRMIDYGCGSGILALAAAKLGANPVIGIDIDPQALRATTHNAQINGVAVEVLPSEAKAPAPADIVVANILSSPLKVLAPLLQSLVRPGGHLVLSGLLERQIDEIIACYGACQWEVHGLREGWACLAGRKSG